MPGDRGTAMARGFRNCARMDATPHERLMRWLLRVAFRDARGAFVAPSLKACGTTRSQ